MKRLREAPTNSGNPKRLNAASRAMQAMLCSGVLPKPMPGSSTMFSRAMPARSLEIAERAGIARDKIVLDPGIGFGKTPEQSIACIARLAEFKRFGLPLLVGASRKRFINAVTPSAPDERLGGSIASHLAAVANGASIVRAHDVAETVQALRVAAAIGRAKES